MPDCGARRSQLTARQWVQVLFVAALGLALTGSLARRGLPLGDVLLGALVTVLATGHVYALLWRENRARQLIAASEQAAREARAGQEQAIQQRRDFMASVGHELGAPLAAIVGFAEALRSGDDRSSSERREVVDTICRSGRRLLNMTSDMLDLSRLEAGRLTVQPADCSVASICAEVETLMRPMAAHRGLRFAIDRSGPIPERIHTDPARLRQIMVNLASQALRAPQRGEARLTVSLDPVASRLLIEAPAGRSAGATARLLSKASAPGRLDSAGLGLVIAQRLADLLGGSVELIATERRPVIRASVATGSLDGVPMIAATAPATAAAPSGAFNVHTPAIPVGPQLEARVLVVDETGDDTRLLAFHLRDAGAEVETEESAPDCARRAMVAHQAGRAFDILIVDNAEEHLAQVRKLRDGGYPGPIIAVSASAEPLDRASCLAAGCQDFVESPVSRAALAEACRRAAAPARQRHPDAEPPAAAELPQRATEAA